MYFDGIRTNVVEVRMKEDMNTKPRAIGLCRVSTAMQEAEGYSLEAQGKAIEEYCAKAGYELLDTYYEQASGRKQDREVVNEVLNRCRSTKSTLIIARLDRFTRDLHFLTKVQKLRDFNFVALDNPHADSMVLQIMMSVAENESRMISKRTRTALRVAKENGIELGNHRSILATYSRLEKDKKLALNEGNDNLWDTFVDYRRAWNDYVINHKNYKIFRKYIDPFYETVDTGLGWEEYIKRPNIYENGQLEFWLDYQQKLKPEKLIGQRYINETWNAVAFGDMCEDAFLMQPLEGATYIHYREDFKYRMAQSSAFHLPQLDMVKSRKKIDSDTTMGLHAREYIRRYKHHAEIFVDRTLFGAHPSPNREPVSIRAYDIGILWQQLLRANTVPATASRVDSARQEALEIYLPIINEAREKGITGIRPLGRYLTEKGIITPKGGATWGASSVQNILRLERDIENDMPLTKEDAGDLADDLIMTLMYNGYALGYKSCYRDESGFITEKGDPLNYERFSQIIKPSKEQIKKGKVPTFLRVEKD